MKTTHKYTTSLILLGIVIILLMTIPEDALARGGGGGGGGGGSGSGGGRRGFNMPAMIFAVIVTIVNVAIISYLITLKNKASKRAIEQAAKDQAWEPDMLDSRVAEVYFKIQHAWMERDQDIAKDCMSNKLYEKHKRQTDEMLLKGTKNILEGVRLNEALIVEVADYKEDSRDRFWVHIKGSMIDYTVLEKSGHVIKGSTSKVEKFTELWKFVRVDNVWVLDEIDPEVEIKDLIFMRAFSE